MNEIKSENCVYCNSVLKQENLVCENCGKVMFPKANDDLSSSNIFILKFGYFFVYFLLGLVAGGISRTFSNGGLFVPWDIGMIALGIAAGRHFSEKKDINPILMITSGSALFGITGSLLYAYLFDFLFLNILFTSVIAVLFGLVIGTVFYFTKFNETKRLLFILLGSAFAGLIANSINGLIVDFTILEEFSLDTLGINMRNGLLSGLVFAVCYILAERILFKKKAFLNIFYTTLGAFICGGILGAIVDATSYNPYWSGLFEVQDNIFLSIRSGFLRDGLMCGLIAFGISVMNTMIKNNNRAKTYIFSILGGIFGGILAVVLMINLPFDLFSFSAVEKTFYDILEGTTLSISWWIIIGGISGGLISLGIIIGRDIFSRDSFSHFIKIIVQSSGGLLGGIIAGVGCGLIISMASGNIGDSEFTLGMVILVSVISSMYGLLIALGMNLTRFNPFSNQLIT